MIQLNVFLCFFRRTNNAWFNVMPTIPRVPTSLIMAASAEKQNNFFQYRPSEIQELNSVLQPFLGLRKSLLTFARIAYKNGRQGNLSQNKRDPLRFTELRLQIGSKREVRGNQFYFVGYWVRQLKCCQNVQVFYVSAFEYDKGDNKLR